MEKDRLSRAREYEQQYGSQIAPLERPMFHVTPMVGWMNDPNGFSYYKGEYHLFYQYHPYTSHWGPMHWGHVVSKDLLHWEFRPAALAPDQPYDQGGCFSGSALTLPDGRHLLMYTGVRLEQQDNGRTCEVQTQCLAVGDGTDYEKYAGNPVLDEHDLPEGGSRFDFRDPKIWQTEDGTYRCVIGNRPADGSGQILLYTSLDGFHWSYKSTLAANQDRIGKMWECPDLFQLDGKWVLLTSPQDMLPQGFEYHNGNGTLCLIGRYDEEKGQLIEEYQQSIDYGIDFYAPQTVLTPDGRRVMIAWMQNWDTCSIRTPEEKWAGQMSIPRELEVRDGRLYQRPIRELEALRTDPVCYKDILISGEVSLDGVKGRTVDLELTLHPEKDGTGYHKFAVRFAQNDRYWTSLSYHPQDHILKIDRKFSGSRRASIHQRRCLVRGERDGLRLRIILDRYSAEIFVNDGEQVITATLYTELEADQITFYAEGDVELDVVKYGLDTGGFDGLGRT